MQGNDTTNGKIGELLSALSDAKQTGDGQWQARCPAHEDHRASLSVSTRDGDGKIGVYCHANCATGDVLAAVGMKLADLMPSRETNSGKAKIVAVYDYRDADFRRARCMKMTRKPFSTPSAR